MADDSSFRSYRSNDPYRRAPEPAREPAGSDPLAELARLIGQNDPMADFGRGSSRQESRQAQPSGYSSRESAPPWPPQTSAKRYSDEPRGAPREAYPSPGEGYDSPLAVLAARAEARRAESQQHDAPRYAADEQLGTFADDRMPAAEQHAQEDEHYYQDEAPLEAHEEQIYDDAPRVRRRGGLATALALVGCAVLGTAGAYAYRSYSVPVSSKEPPPVIAADPTPTKVVAAPPADQTSKQISERFANAVTGDSLVSRQEEPVALREPAAPPAPPRVVVPAPVPPANANPPPVAANPPAATAQPPAATPEGPKRIRTVTIRPDGTDNSGRPASAGNASTTPPAPRAAAQPRNNNSNNSNAPLSLSPQSQGAESAPRPRVAAREPVGTVSAGGYVVQLSSQKTEGEAQASFRALQAKFPNELGDRQLIVRRADLGSKGVVYRANVGPFASASEAQQFCANYKAAGGQCIVPHN